MGNIAFSARWWLTLLLWSVDGVHCPSKKVMAGRRYQKYEWFVQQSCLTLRLRTARNVWSYVLQWGRHSLKPLSTSKVGEYYRMSCILPAHPTLASPVFS